MTDSLIVALDGPEPESLAVADAALAADRAHADLIVFPVEITPATEDALLQYATMVDRIPAGAAAPAAMATMHRRAVKAHPALARLLRSAEALDDLAAAAAQTATPTDHTDSFAAARARAGAAAIAAYKHAIAEQLVACDGHELRAAAQALVDCDARAARLETAMRDRAVIERERGRADAERLQATTSAALQARQVREAAEAAAEAEAEAKRSREAARLARAELLADRLGRELEKSKHRDLQIRVGRVVSSIRSVIAAASMLTVEQLAQYEQAWCCGQFVGAGES